MAGRVDRDAAPGHGAGCVLIVDDESINRDMLSSLLEPEGHKVLTCGDGREALDLLSAEETDCVLLDLLMPVMGGIEVCRLMKSDPSTAMIPIIVITAERGAESRIEAIDAGADDFLTKPYDAEEVRLRVRNAVRTKRLYDRVQSDLERLKALESTKDTFTHMLIHDLKQPLTAIKAYGDLLATRLGGEPNGSFARKISDLVASVETMIALILDLTRLEEGKMPLKLGAYSLRQILSEAVDLNSELASGRNIVIEQDDVDHELHCDRELVSRIALNLLSNALKFTPDGKSIRVTVEEREGSIGFSIRDEGPGIPEKYHSLIFEKFGQVEMGNDRKKYSSGLGLTFCKLAAEAHHGSIAVDSRPDEGSTFTVLFPRHDF